MNSLKEYLPKHKELLWGWDNDDDDMCTLCRYDDETKVLSAIMEVRGDKMNSIKEYLPKHKELVCDDDDEDMCTLCHFDDETKVLSAIMEARADFAFKHYAPYDGTPPPNIGVDSLKGLGVENEQS